MSVHPPTTVASAGAVTRTTGRPAGTSRASHGHARLPLALAIAVGVLSVAGVLSIAGACRDEVPDHTMRPPRPTLVASSPEADDGLPRDRADVNHGATLWDAHCTRCHGPDGDASGPFARGLSPAPADLSNRDIVLNRPPTRFHRAIERGVVGSAMPRFDTLLDDDELWDVTFHAWTLAGSPGAVARGRELYEERCAGCHGSEGGQKGLPVLNAAERAGRSRADEAEALRRAHPAPAVDLDKSATDDLIDFLFSGLYSLASP